MSPYDPHEVAIGIARAAQAESGYAEARGLLVAYAREGLDPLRIAYAACKMLAVADEELSAAEGQPAGWWLAMAGQRIADRLCNPPG